MKYKRNKNKNDYQLLVGGQKQKNDIFKLLRGKFQPRILCSATISLKNEGEIKVFSAIQKLREWYSDKNRHIHQ